MPVSAAPRHALIVPRSAPIAPFGELAGDCPVLNRPLRALLVRELAEAGLTVVEAPPADAPYVLVSDRTWVTAPALRRLMAQAQAPARLKVTDPVWAELTAALQELDEPGLYEVAILPAGAPPRFDGVPGVEIDLGFEAQPSKVEHWAMAHAAPPRLVTSDANVHQIDHWTHLLRVNWLAIAATFEREKRKFQALNPLVKLWRVLGLLARARSLNPFVLAQALTVRGKGAVIHPTAVVEACVLGDKVEIGPYAVVRGAVIGDGVKIEEHAIVNASVLGDGARVSRRGMVNLCVAFPGAFISSGDGHQACVFGRDSFVAWGVTTYDLAFDKPVRVAHRGARVSSGAWFLGCAIGHRARLGAHVQLGYGSEVPNEAFVVGPSDGVLRGWEPGPSPHRVQGGVARSVGGLRPGPGANNPASSQE